MALKGGNMKVTAKFTECSRAMDRLHGILAGISSDYKLEDKEIAELYNWLNIHEYLHDLYPFSDTVTLLKRCLEDGLIDEDEREDILEWCLAFHNSLPTCPTSAIRRLHGLLHGTVIDDTLRDEEIIGIRDWLEDHEIFREYWPFNETWELIEHILADGVITKEEKADFLEFCKGFKECVIDNPDVHDSIYGESYMQSDSPYLKPFTALCDREAKIKFSGRAFCFTGPARIGPRRQLVEIVKSLEGIPYKTVIKNLDYLVIGAQSSPAWAYSTYGRKIEKVIEWRQKGQEILILHEDDFILQATKHLPELSS